MSVIAAALVGAGSGGAGASAASPRHGLRIIQPSHRATPRRQDADPVSLVAARLQALGCDNSDINLQGVGEGEVTNVPPAGFDPLTASNTQLRCFGFPLRPSDAADLAVWTQEMSGRRTSSSPR